MAQTNVEIINIALTRLGAPTITSLDEQTREAEVMNVLFQPVFYNVLTGSDWNFAMKDVELAKTTNTPTDTNFIYEFTLPADYLNSVRFFDAAGTTIETYQIQKGQIYANVERLFAKYTAEPSIPSLPPYFVSLMALELAVAAQEAIIGIGTVQQRLDAELDLSRLNARRLDNRENPQQDALAPSRFVRVRH